MKDILNLVKLVTNENGEVDLEYIKNSEYVKKMDRLKLLASQILIIEKELTVFSEEFNIDMSNIKKDKDLLLFMGNIKEINDDLNFNDFLDLNTVMEGHSYISECITIVSALSDMAYMYLGKLIFNQNISNVIDDTSGEYQESFEWWFYGDGKLSFYEYIVKELKESNI